MNRQPSPFSSKAKDRSALQRAYFTIANISLLGLQPLKATALESSIGCGAIIRYYGDSGTAISVRPENRLIYFTNWLNLYSQLI